MQKHNENHFQVNPKEKMKQVTKNSGLKDLADKNNSRDLTEPNR